MLAKTFKVAKEDYEISADVLLENKDLLVFLDWRRCSSSWWSGDI